MKWSPLQRWKSAICGGAYLKQLWEQEESVLNSREYRRSASCQNARGGGEWRGASHDPAYEHLGSMWQGEQQATAVAGSSSERVGRGGQTSSNVDPLGEEKAGEDNRHS